MIKVIVEKEPNIWAPLNTALGSKTNHIAAENEKVKKATVQTVAGNTKETDTLRYVETL